jgi:hexosaminidase
MGAGMKKKVNILWILTMIFCSTTHEIKKETSPLQPNLIPEPLEVRTREGQFILSEETGIDNRAGQIAEKIIDQFQDYLERFYDLQLTEHPVREKAPKETWIQWDIQPDMKNWSEEGYMFAISPKIIRIKSGTAAGLFYGTQTLLQLLPVEKNSELLLPGVQIIDKPRFKWRGMHLDVCRHFFPVAFIKKYLDILAMHKMNVFHWHLTEDQGWRIEIRQYPKLTEIGAWRVDREHQHWNERTPPEPGEKATYGGFYTQDEVREIVQYAAERFITVVPEIEMPGHALAALAAYPELSCTGGPFYVMPGSYWPINDIYCAGKERTFEFLENVLSEVADLFPGPYVHIGGDEAGKANWEQCSDCQARIQNEGLHDEHELQSYFIKRIEEFLASKHKKLVGWDEILEGGLAPRATVMSWRGMEGGIEASKAGHDVVMSPTTHCYLDYYQSADQENEPVAIGGYLPIDTVYTFDPMPPDLEADKQHHILGAQGNVWTEYMPNGNHVEYMALPRLCALAEVVWSVPEKRDLAGFKNRLKAHYRRLDMLDINYRNHETGKPAKPTPKTYYTE